MKTIPYSTFKNGQRVTYVINGQTISKAKIIKDKDTVYVSPYYIAICWQDGEYNEEKCSVKNLKFLARTIDDLEEGDVLVDNRGNERKILGICGEVCFLSFVSDLSEYSHTKSISTIKTANYTIKQDIEEEEKEIQFTIPTEEEAIIIYQKEVHEWGRDQIVTSEDISEDWVRFYRGESDGEVVNAWWLDQKGKKRAKPVWIFTPLKQQRI